MPIPSADMHPEHCGLCLFAMFMSMIHILLSVHTHSDYCVLSLCLRNVSSADAHPECCDLCSHCFHMLIPSADTHSEYRGLYLFVHVPIHVPISIRIFDTCSELNANAHVHCDHAFSHCVSI